MIGCFSIRFHSGLNFFISPMKMCLGWWLILLKLRYLWEVKRLSLSSWKQHAVIPSDKSFCITNSTMRWFGRWSMIGLLRSLWLNLSEIMGQGMIRSLEGVCFSDYFMFYYLKKEDLPSFFIMFMKTVLRSWVETK